MLDEQKELEAALQANVEKSMVAPFERLTTWTSKMQKPPTEIEWVVDRMVSRGRISMMYGPGGIGKSMLATHIALSAIQGTKVLGEFPVIQGNVLWIDNENGEEENDRRAQLLDRMKRSNIGENNIYFSEIPEFCFKAKQVDFDHVSNLIDILRPSLVVIDSFVSILDGEDDENTAKDVRAIMDGLTRMIKLSHASQGGLRESPPGLLLIHHAKKQEDTSQWPAFRGSSDIKSAVSVMLSMMGKKVDYGDRVRFRWEKMRNGIKPQDTYEYSVEDRFEADNSKWLEVVSYGALKEEKAQTKRVVSLDMAIHENMEEGVEYSADEIAKVHGKTRADGGFRKKLIDLEKNEFIIRNVNGKLQKGKGKINWVEPKE